MVSKRALDSRQVVPGMRPRLVVMKADRGGVIEVVDALTGCARWSLDLLSWLADCLFELANDEEFGQRLTPQRFSEVAAYLDEKKNVSLHLTLCSSSRSFLSALCRRIAHLEALSNKAIEFYRRQSALADQAGTGKTANPQLQQAYQRMQRVTTSNRIPVGELEKLLNGLGVDIRQVYKTGLPNMVAKGPSGASGKQLELAVKGAQMQFEVGMLLATAAPPAFLPVMKKFLSKDVRAFRALTDPAKLFFADFKLLGMQDEAARGGRRIHVDLFKRVELRRSREGARWRRCTRCASVMEDVFGSRPGFTFVLGQQRKCSCGGHWALLPPGKLVP